MLTDLTQITAASIAPVFGLVSIFSTSAVVSGALSDRIGCNHTFAAMFAVQALTVLLLANVHALVPALAAVSVILFCCGGGFGTMPSNVACFGTEIHGAELWAHSIGMGLRRTDRACHCRPRQRSDRIILRDAAVHVSVAGLRDPSLPHQRSVASIQSGCQGLAPRTLRRPIPRHGFCLQFR